MLFILSSFFGHRFLIAFFSVFFFFLSRNNTPDNTYQLNQDSIKLAALLRDPSFEAAFNCIFNLGLVQLLEALVQQDLPASQDPPPPACNVEVLQPFSPYARQSGFIFFA